MCRRFGNSVFIHQTLRRCVFTKYPLLKVFWKSAVLSALIFLVKLKAGNVSQSLPPTFILRQCVLTFNTSISVSFCGLTKEQIKRLFFYYICNQVYCNYCELILRPGITVSYKLASGKSKLENICACIQLLQLLFSEYHLPLLKKTT